MGVAITRQAEEGHNAGEPGGLCAEYHAEGQPLDLCALEPGPEGQDEAHRLLAAGGQSVAPRSGDGDPVQGHSTGEHRRRTAGEESRVLQARSVRQPVPH